MTSLVCVFCDELYQIIDDKWPDNWCVIEINGIDFAVCPACGIDMEKHQ